MNALREQHSDKEVRETFASAILSTYPGMRGADVGRLMMKVFDDVDRESTIPTPSPGSNSPRVPNPKADKKYLKVFATMATMFPEGSAHRSSSKPKVRKSRKPEPEDKPTVRLARTSLKRQIPPRCRLIVEIDFSELIIRTMALRFSRAWSVYGGLFQHVVEYHQTLISRSMPTYHPTDTVEHRQDALSHLFEMVVSGEEVVWVTEIRNRFLSVLLYSWLRKELEAR
jgi:hypothetical protein